MTSFRTIVHEYVHVLFDAPGLPLWLSEGIADYYSTTTLSRDRRRVVLGDRIPAHLAQASRWWVPLSQVLSVPRSARLSNDDTDMSFYAESWLLVHYLMRGTPARGAQIARFLDLLAGGRDGGRGVRAGHRSAGEDRSRSAALPGQRHRLRRAADTDQRSQLAAAAVASDDGRRGRRHPRTTAVPSSTRRRGGRAAERLAERSIRT